MPLFAASTSNQLKGAIRRLRGGKGIGFDTPSAWHPAWGELPQSRWQVGLQVMRWATVMFKDISPLPKGVNG